MQEGLIPPNARLLEVVIPADGAVIFRYEVYLVTDDLPKLSRALLALHRHDVRIVTSPGGEHPTK